MSLASEFRTFIARGNVVDLAVGVIIGAAFGKIVTSLVDQVIMPPIGILTGGVDFSAMKWVLKPGDAATKAPETAIQYGAFLNTLIQFLIIAFVVFLAGQAGDHASPARGGSARGAARAHSFGDAADRHPRPAGAGGGAARLTGFAGSTGGNRRPAATLPARMSLPDWPSFGLTDDVRPALAAARDAGEPAALATLALAVGGAPRPPGAQMLVTEDGVSGFLSGGCVEGDVVVHARATLADGAPRRLVYGEGGPWPDIRLLCGARIELLVERVAPDDPAVARLLELTAARRPAVWWTDGTRRAVTAEGEAAPAFAPVLARRFAPRPRTVVVGGDPTALAIASLAASLGDETHLVRPRGPQAPPPVPGARYHRGEPEHALDAVPLDAWTAVAVATHDLETDEAALAAALPSAAAYVGVLGARRRIPERRARLLARGVAPEALARLRAPIGLDLGGKAPWEIAVAVLAEVVAARHLDAPPLLAFPPDAERG